MIFWLLIALVIVIAVGVGLTSTWSAAENVGLTLIAGGFLVAILSMFATMGAGQSAPNHHDVEKIKLVPIDKSEGTYLIGSQENTYTFLADSPKGPDTLYVYDSTAEINYSDKDPYYVDDQPSVSLPWLIPWTVLQTTKYTFYVPEGSVVEAYELTK
jgi:hypothetical protein